MDRPESGCPFAVCFSVCDYSPPANGGFAGGRPTYESCAPMRPGSQEESATITGVLRLAEPHRSRVPDPDAHLRSPADTIPVAAQLFASNTQASYGCIQIRFSTVACSAFVDSIRQFLLATRVGRSIWQVLRLRFVSTSTCFVSDLRR